MDKRAHPRYQTQQNSTVTFNGQKAFSTITNVSEEGISLVCIPDVKIGQILVVSFNKGVGALKKRISVIIEVVHSARDSYETLLGAKIQKSSIDYQDYIKEFQNI